MARNLVKYDVTKLSRAAFSDRRKSALLERKEIQQTQEIAKAKFLREILFLSIVIAVHFYDAVTSYYYFQWKWESTQNVNINADMVEYKSALKVPSVISNYASKIF